jgi:hypothetical protein
LFLARELSPAIIEARRAATIIAVSRRIAVSLE